MHTYHIAHQRATWLEMNDYGQLLLQDRDRLDLMDRISTNKLKTLAANAGAATVFLTANARILDYVVVVNQGETVLVITEPQRADAFSNFLTRNIFWNDRLQVENQSAQWVQFGLVGPAAAGFLEDIGFAVNALELFQMAVQDEQIVIRVRDMADTASFWWLAPLAHREQIRTQLQEKFPEATQADYEALRIAAGIPRVGHELTEQYIPLELGLWDTISFNKGCYTGQEIIARMESRGQLAKNLVKITSQGALAAGDTLFDMNGKQTGTITSVATIPDDEQPYIALAVIKTGDAVVGQNLLNEQKQVVHIRGLAGTYTPIYD